VTGGNPPWTSIAAGNDQTCAIDSAHLLYCAGAAGLGALAAIGSRTTPVMVGASVDAMAGGTGFTCSIAGGALSCVGANTAGTVGDNTGLDRELAVPLAPQAGASGWIAVAAGTDACALDTLHHLYCWGGNDSMQVGTGNTNNVPAPQPIASPNQYDKVVTTRHTCVLASGHMFCWGANVNGECAASPSTSVATTGYEVTQVNGSWLDVAVGDVHTCAIDSVGVVWCWGYGGVGSLGDSSSSSSSSPVRITGVAGLPAAFDTIASGGTSSCARTTAGEVWCWGDNEHGQLGDMTKATAFAPEKLAGMWLQVSLGREFACGVDTNHALWCFGANEHGQLGIGSFAEKTQAVQVGTDTNWASVAAGDTHVCATKTDHSMWCWGHNESGQLGDGTAWSYALRLISE
jgi:alpha-tubulin suppressor-like RCC1 family protein